VLGSIELVELDKAGHKILSTLVLPLASNTDFAVDDILTDHDVALLCRDFAELLSPLEDEPYDQDGYDQYIDRDGEDLITPSSNPFDDMASDIDDLDDEKQAILDYVFES